LVFTLNKRLKTSLKYVERMLKARLMLHYFTIHN
jgi:hypothetical protein